MEVFIDGGFRRGVDVLKALCLGAKAVGLGRPFLYAVNYGSEGVGRCVDSKSSCCMGRFGVWVVADCDVFSFEGGDGECYEVVGDHESG